MNNNQTVYSDQLLAYYKKMKMKIINQEYTTVVHKLLSYIILIIYLPSLQHPDRRGRRD